MTAALTRREFLKLGVAALAAAVAFRRLGRFTPMPPTMGTALRKRFESMMCIVCGADSGNEWRCTRHHHGDPTEIRQAFTDSFIDSFIEASKLSRSLT